MKMRRLAFLIMAAALFVAVSNTESYSQTRKELLRENQKLRRAIDSLQRILDDSEIEVADTTTSGDTINPGNIGFLNSELYENITPGENPDSLLSIYYLQRQMATANLPAVEDVENANYTSNIPDEVYIENLKKMNSFISLPYNSVVKNYIILYTERMPKRAANMLGLASYYLPIFENIFDSYGLPKELAAMAIIESALNPFAVSSANAKGLWQFIYSAAKQYNLQVDSYVDERFDPEKSCDAAARFLKDSYTIFGDWALAISSYNCGPGNVNKAIKRAGSRDFWSIYPYLPKETRGYMPSFVGALYMLKYYQNYNIVPDKPSMPAHVDTFMIHKNLHFEQISEVIGIPVQELRQLNPQYLKDIIPGDSKGMLLRLPYNYTVPFVDNEKTIYNYKDSIFFNPIVYSRYKSADEGGSSRIYHKVRKGQTLASIAKRYGVTVSQIKDWNNLSSKTKSVKTGRTLIIYRNAVSNTSRSSSSSSSSSSASSSSSSKSNASSSKSSGGTRTYTVKKGDTLYGIAKKHNMSLNDLLKMNGLTAKSTIHAGKKLKVK
ncbi:MAG: LysM peptidoglycan-binding domain-containing protein [Bacteroidales bacterium]|nr:LysM peptidoglycan-binding domain-containing protein [Bacteroidales bacterium]